MSRVTKDKFKGKFGRAILSEASGRRKNTTMKISTKAKIALQTFFRSVSLFSAAIFSLTVLTGAVGAQTPELQRILDQRQATLKRMEKTACGFNAGSCRMKGGKAVAEQEQYKKQLDAFNNEYLEKYAAFLDAIIPANGDVVALRNHESKLTEAGQQVGQVLKNLKCGSLFPGDLRNQNECALQKGILERIKATREKTIELREEVRYDALPVTGKITETAFKWLKIAGLFVLGILILTAIYFLFLRKRKIKPSGVHGNAHFASPKELIKSGFLMEADDHPTRFYVSSNKIKRSFLIRSKKTVLALPPKSAEKHVMILGGTGTGKSRRFFMPNMKDSANKLSVFVTDPSGEIAEQTSGCWRRTQLFIPAGDSPNKFNFIPLCRDSILADNLAKTLVLNSSGKSPVNQEWKQFSKEIVAAIFSHLAASRQPYPHLAYDIVMSPHLAEILKESSSGQARAVGESLASESPTLVSNKLAGAKSALEFLKHDNIREFCYSDEAVNFNFLQDRPTAAFWIIPETDADVYKPLTCLAFQIIMKQLLSKKVSDPVNVRLLLDEFDDLGNIPDFTSRIKDIRKHGVSIVAGVQSISQLYSHYGQHEADIIYENLQTKIALSGLGGRSAKTISEALGTTTVAVEHKSKTQSSRFGSQPSVTRSVQEFRRELMTPSELRQIEEDKAIVISGRECPFIAPLEFFDNPHKTRIEGLRKRNRGVNLPKLDFTPQKAEVAQTAKAADRVKIPDLPEMPEMPKIKTGQSREREERQTNGKDREIHRDF